MSLIDWLLGRCSNSGLGGGTIVAHSAAQSVGGILGAVEQLPTRGGSEPADKINPAALAVMAEIDIDITAEQPKRWTVDMVEAADVVVTMGCGDTCPLIPGRDWTLPDLARRQIDAVRPIRDEIENRVRRLPADLGAID